MLGRIMVTIILVYLIPSVLVLLFGAVDAPQRPTECAPQIWEATENPAQQAPVMLVSVLADAVVTEQALEDYVLCVTLAEMPAEFELEALKAQAVVARTYTCKRLETVKHQGGAVCTDSACCQAYISVEEYLHAGGTQSAVDKVRKAVSETEGQVLLYQGDYIEATYFSCSGGRTEDAQAVWGNAVPYLQSVESPGEEGAVHYTDTVSLSKAEFLRKLELSENHIKIDSITYTEGGGVSAIVICGQRFFGTELRSRLGLRSTAFAITAAGERVTITTKGFGHRVGLSQYGAEAMAVQGKTYDTILLHYYQGAELTARPG